MKELLNRNRKVYTRDRLAFFMSFLSVVILIAIYQIFLGELQLDYIKAAMGTDSVSTDVRAMVNNWLIAGLVTIVSMTGTLGAFHVMIQDKEKKIDEDLRITPYSRFKIEWSYAIFAILFGIMITAFACLFAIILFNGFHSLFAFDMKAYVQILGLIILSNILSAVLVLPILKIIRTVSSYSMLSTIIGTLIGFLSGVYISIGFVSKPIRQVMTWFPLTQINAMLKQILMKSSMQTVFEHADIAVIDEYKLNYGVTLFNHSGAKLTNHAMLVYLFIVMISLTLLHVFMKKRIKN